MRPRIICHMMSSIDGRLLTQRWTRPASGIGDDIVPRHYEQVAARLGGDGFLIGRKTMEEYACVTAHEPTTGGDAPRKIHVADRKGRAIAVVVDPHGKLHYAKDDASGDHIVAVLSETVSDDYLATLRKAGISYLFAGADGTDLSGAMDVLGASFDIQTILLEGGGRINGAFLKAGLIDEISLLIYPGIDGLAGVSSIFEYVGTGDERPAAGRSLRHMATETLEGGMVWLRYCMEESPPGA
ncbi:5-amino-6-(5-phosphoribosylamino)uracil reductase [Rhodoblastus sphagnicola]|uniref:5-amino-6-(5-phosphoribosylamino)uracil reductase n=1 Tax=Rhodoblastus sphagnicola TaxID=333368 RepID=A0A2S6N0P4_9HYPH|nr:dihydrofolate reductase family protein [Rhodoblastus sphagnicola]MBB4200474.1 5-amino-6-(5-phosphoribosylamino)uracil reductase [Rhodoblastus sphagnicola]PPQ28191.1 5-amino-6-(5-phosphoribosylamino)uracil reductase [Rhodoblastus sphagnicola]